MANSFELKAVITAVDKLSGPLRGMQKQLKGFQKEFSSLAMGASGLGAGILAPLAAAAKQAIDFESEMANVRKVVDGLESPAAFRQMQDDILELTTKIPMAAGDMADLIAQAGQSGIPREELKRFGEDAAKIGVAWDLSGREAGKTLAVWRTAFGLTQKEVVDLADKVNYLGNTGPANAAEISKVVTELGGVAKSANVASGDVAALASTIIGVGINGDVAQTGIKNFIMGLTSASSARQKSVARAIGWTPDKLAKGMVKDARGTMLQVLESISRMKPDKQTKAMTWLFGKESSTATIPLLSNLEKLKENFHKVTDAQLYGGAAANEYATAADTAANDLALMKNELSKLSIEMGREFIPIVRDAVKTVMPFIRQASQFVKHNPEFVMTVAKMGTALLGTGVAIGSLSRAFKIMNGVFNLTPAKGAIALLVGGAYLIIENWDKIGPVIREVWHHIDDVAQAMGGWEAVIKGIAALSGLYIGVRFIANIRSAIGAQESWTRAAQRTGTALKGIGKISLIGGLIELGLMAQEFEKNHPWLVKNFVSDALNSGFGLNNTIDDMGKKFHDFVYQKSGWNMPRGDGYFSGPGYSPAISLDRAVSPMQQRSELKVVFENAPQGMRVAEFQRPGNPLMSISTDVGYSPFRSK